MASLPIEFLAASWANESGEGVDEYFKAKGTPWMIRKLILASPHVISWKDLGDGRFAVEHKTLTSLTFEFRIGEEFTAKGFDQSQQKILVSTDGNTIVERFQKADKPNDPPEIYTYRIDGTKLIQTMERAGVSCTRLFKKKN